MYICLNKSGKATIGVGGTFWCASFFGVFVSPKCEEGEGKASSRSAPGRCVSPYI